MNHFWQFQLSLLILLAIAYMLYRTVVQKQSSWQAQRLYLIGTSLGIPLVLILSQWLSSLTGIETKVNIYQLTIPSIIPEVGSDGLVVAPSARTGLDLVTCSLIFYAAGAIYLLALLLLQMSRFSSKFKFFAHCEKHGLPAASYHTYVWIDPQLTSEQREVARYHENGHVHYRHTIDKVAMEILRALLWLNPFIHLHRKEIYNIHEYQADRYALDQGKSDTKSYALCLASMCGYQQSYSLAHPFIHSIQNRIKMIYNHEDKNHMKYSAWLLLGILLIFTTAWVIPSAHPSPANEEQATLAERYYGPILQVCHDASPDDKYAQQECTQNRIIEYIYGKIKYPEEARKKQIEGLIVVQFDINTKGQGHDVRIVKSLDPSCDGVAKYTVSSMLSDDGFTFVPRVKDGQLVQDKFTLPIKFKLEGEKKE